MNANKESIERLQQKLPQQPGINGKDEFFNSVVLLLLVRIDGEYHIVFEKRSANIRQAGEICLPGGKCEDDERSALERTALRETEEELGIQAKDITILGRLDTVIAPMGATIDVFVGITDIPPASMIQNPLEVQTVFTLPVSFFEKNPPEIYKGMVEIHPSYIDQKTGEEVVLLPSRKLGLPEKYYTSWGGFRYNIYAYITEYGTIWGITAKIIRNFIQHLSS